MSNYWATRLGVNTAPAAPERVMPQARPWWQTEYVPAGAPSAAPAAPVAPVQQVPAPEPDEGGWGTVAGSMAKAKSSRLTNSCPECGGTNVFRPEGQPNAMEQCYNCGWNPRFSQTSGAGGLPSDASGPATPARQISSGGAGGVSQFNPGNIVARVN